MHPFYCEESFSSDFMPHSLLFFCFCYLINDVSPPKVQLSFPDRVFHPDASQHSTE